MEKKQNWKKKLSSKYNNKRSAAAVGVLGYKGSPQLYMMYKGVLYSN